MDKALQIKIGAKCETANRVEVGGGHRSLFFFSEEGTLAKWDQNARPMFCIRRHGFAAFEHFVPEELVTPETIMLIDRVAKWGSDIGYIEGKRIAQKTMRGALGIEEPKYGR